MEEPVIDFDLIFSRGALHRGYFHHDPFHGLSLQVWEPKADIAYVEWADSKVYEINGVANASLLRFAYHLPPLRGCSKKSAFGSHFVTCKGDPCTRPFLWAKDAPDGILRLCGPDEKLEKIGWPKDAPDGVRRLCRPGEKFQEMEGLLGILWRKLEVYLEKSHPVEWRAHQKILELDDGWDLAQAVQLFVELLEPNLETSEDLIVPVATAADQDSFLDLAVKLCKRTNRDDQSSIVDKKGNRAEQLRILSNCQEFGPTACSLFRTVMKLWEHKNGKRSKEALAGILQELSPVSTVVSALADPLTFCKSISIVQSIVISNHSHPVRKVASLRENFNGVFVWVTSRGIGYTGIHVGSGWIVVEAKAANDDSSISVLNEDGSMQKGILLGPSCEIFYCQPFALFNLTSVENLSAGAFTGASYTLIDGVNPAQEWDSALYLEVGAACVKAVELPFSTFCRKRVNALALISSNSSSVIHIRLGGKCYDWLWIIANLEHDFLAPLRFLFQFPLRHITDPVDALLIAVSAAKSDHIIVGDVCRWITSCLEDLRDIKERRLFATFALKFALWAVEHGIPCSDIVYSLQVELDASASMPEITGDDVSSPGLSERWADENSNYEMEAENMDMQELLLGISPQPLSYDNLDQFLVDSTTLDLKQVIPESFNLPGLTPSKVIELAQKIDPTKGAGVTSIVLAQTHIGNDDLDKLKELATWFPNVRKVDLKHTRVQAPTNGQNPLKWIFELQRLECVDVCFTPLVSPEGMAFLCCLSDDFLKKMRFLPTSWLDGSSWRLLVPKHKQEIVLQSHLKSGPGE